MKAKLSDASSLSKQSDNRMKGIINVTPRSTSIKSSKSSAASFKRKVLEAKKIKLAK